MSLDVKNQQISAQTGVTQVTQASTSNTTTPTNSVVNCGELGAPVDTVNTNNNNANITQTKRTVDELYNAVASICKENGINISDIKNANLLSYISGKTEEQLLNAEQSEINKIVETIKKLVVALKEDNVEINAENIKKYDRLINKGEIPAGWSSVESFREKQRVNNENLAERLNRMYGCDITKLKPEEIAKYLEKYFHGYFDQLKSAGHSDSKIVQLQLSDFTKLLFNSSEKDRQLFKEALSHLVHDNRSKGYTAIIDSFFTQEDKTQFRESTTLEDIKKITGGVDDFGNFATQENITELVTAAGKDTSVEHLRELASDIKDEEFYTEENIKILEKINQNPEIIQNIQNKIRNNEELTEEEQAIYKVYTQDSLYKGTLSAIALCGCDNAVISEEQKISFLCDVNHKVHKISQKFGNNKYYREVMSNAHKYINEHPEAFTMTVDQFIETMNKATNGNLSTIINDIENGTNTELATPTEYSTPNLSTETNTNNTSTSPSLGFETRPEVPTDNTLALVHQILTNSIQNESKEPTNTMAEENDKPTNKGKKPSISEIAKGSTKDFIKYVKDNGAFSTVVDVYNNLGDITNKGVLSIAEKLYSMLNPSRQEDILRSITSNGGFNALLNKTSSRVVMNLKTNFNSHYTNQLVEKAQEKAQEKLA